MTLDSFDLGMTRRCQLRRPCHEYARKRLKAVAKRLGRTETEVARERFLRGVGMAERAEFYERVSAEMTPESSGDWVLVAIDPASEWW